MHTKAARSQGSRRPGTASNLAMCLSKRAQCCSTVATAPSPSSRPSAWPTFVPTSLRPSTAPPALQKSPMPPAASRATTASLSNARAPPRRRWAQRASAPRPFGLRCDAMRRDATHARAHRVAPIFACGRDIARDQEPASRCGGVAARPKALPRHSRPVSQHAHRVRSGTAADEDNCRGLGAGTARAGKPSHIGTLLRACGRGRHADVATEISPAVGFGAPRRIVAAVATAWFRVAETAFSARLG